jgi:hypothetical protein
MGAKLLLESRRKYLVAGLEPFDILADGFHVTGQFHAVDRVSWPPQT